MVDLLTTSSWNLDLAKGILSHELAYYLENIVVKWKFIADNEINRFSKSPSFLQLSTLHIFSYTQPFQTFDWREVKSDRKFRLGFFCVPVYVYWCACVCLCVFGCACVWVFFACVWALKVARVDKLSYRPPNRPKRFKCLYNNFANNTFSKHIMD